LPFEKALMAGPDPMKLLGYDPTKVPSASPVGPLPDVGMDPGYWKDVLGPDKPQAQAGAGASFDERFKGAPATETGTVGSGAIGVNATAEQMAQQARDKLAKLMGSYDQPSLEQFQKGAPVTAETVPVPEPRPATAPTTNPLEAIKEALPGEAGRGGMTGRPSPAEPAIEWKDGVPLPRARPAAADVPRPEGEIFPARRLAPNGQEPEAFIVHHTEGNPTLKSVTDYWRGGSEGRGRGLGTQYFMDRDGGIHDVRAETGYTGLGQTYDANQPGTIGLNNRNIVGMEISAKNDQDVTPAQLDALKRFVAARYPDTPAYGHKEIEGGKGEAEGFSGARAILQDRPPLFNFDWSKAPIPVPAQTVVDPITGRMGPNPNLSAGASAAPPRVGGFGGDEFSGQLPSAGAFTPYPNFREGGRFESRTDEQPGRNELAELQTRGFGYDPRLLPETASTPLGTEAGLGDLLRSSKPSLPDVGEPLIPSGGQVSPGIADLFKPPPSGSALPEVERSPVGGEFSPGIPGLNDYARKFWTQNTRDPNSPTEYTTASPLVNITKQDINDAITFGEAFSGDLIGKRNVLPAIGGVFATPAIDSSVLDQPHPNLLPDLGAAFPGEATREELAKVMPLMASGGESNRFDDAFSAFQPPAGEIEGEAGRGGMTGRAQLASLVSDPNRKSMSFGGFSASPEPRKGGVGPEMDAPSPEFMQTIAKVESDFNPKNVTGRYKGLYQLSDKEFKDYGGKGSIFEPDENARVAALKMMDEGQKAQDRLGRALTPPEQYMVHQQGLYGTLAHLANPDQTAWKSFQQASGNSEERSKTAIWKNMTPEMKAQFGNDVNNVTSRDFIKIWTDHYNALQRPGKQ